MPAISSNDDPVPHPVIASSHIGHGNDALDMDATNNEEMDEEVGTREASNDEGERMRKAEAHSNRKKTQADLEQVRQKTQRFEADKLIYVGELLQLIKQLHPDWLQQIEAQSVAIEGLLKSEQITNVERAYKNHLTQNHGGQVANVNFFEVYKALMNQVADKFHSRVPHEENEEFNAWVVEQHGVGLSGIFDDPTDPDEPNV